jgi:bifunctional non-homologous end joining protein LigD
MAGLSNYRTKRRFNVTTEPRGRVGKRGNAFVVQKHDARRLHYDLRLQLDGVMKSWAVTRGPSLVPGDKRLAVQVEDHPIDYNKFEGTIPEGEYGAGTVMVWDRGRWTPEGDPEKGLSKGHLSFQLKGKKLNGGWHLVRMRRRSGEKRDNWLLIKQRDEEARTRRDKDILEERPLSVKTGRSMDEIARHKRKAKRTPRSRRKTKHAKTGRRTATKTRRRTKRAKRR